MDVLDKINDSEMILIGIGNEVSFLDKVNYSQKYTKKEWCNIVSSLTEFRKKEIIDFYNKLAKILEKKNYFIVTTNVDGLIYESELNPLRIVAPCGNVNRLQCACGGEIGLIDSKKDFFETNEYKCERCNMEFEPNIYNPEYYNEEGYLKQWNLYNKWLQGTLNKNLLVLEMGCDFSMLSIIRMPFEKIVLINQKAYYFRINNKFPQITAELKERMNSFECSCFDFVNDIIKE